MEESGVKINFVRYNQSMIIKGVLRGLHFYKNFLQTKLVRVIKGAVFDVVADLRFSNKSFGKWYGHKLAEENEKQFLIPMGFLVLSDTAEFSMSATVSIMLMTKAAFPGMILRLVLNSLKSLECIVGVRLPKEIGCRMELN